MFSGVRGLGCDLQSAEKPPLDKHWSVHRTVSPGRCCCGHFVVPTRTADTRGQRQQETRAKTKQSLWTWPTSKPSLLKPRKSHLQRLLLTPWHPNSAWKTHSPLCPVTFTADLSLNDETNTMRGAFCHVWQGEMLRMTCPLTSVSHSGCRRVIQTKLHHYLNSTIKSVLLPKPLTVPRARVDLQTTNSAFIFFLSYQLCRIK